MKGRQSLAGCLCGKKGGDGTETLCLAAPGQWKEGRENRQH